MHYFLEDLIGLAAGTALAALLLVLPGFGLLSLARRAGAAPADSFASTCWGLILGAVLLPALDALLLRWVGMASVLGLHALLALIGTRDGYGAARRVPSRGWLALLGLWLAVAWCNVDFDWNRRLYQSLSAFDTVKHGAVIAAIAQRGVPFADPFFARPGITGYYYYFYLGPALLHWIGGTLVDTRAAFGAGTLVTLVAFPAMLLLVAQQAALIAEGARRRFSRILSLLYCVQGFDVLAGVFILVATGITLRQLETWNPEIRWTLTTTLWVPHHVTAVIAVFAGCLALVAPRGPQVLRAIVAGVAFATAFGCSVWVALAAAFVLPVWWLVERGKAGTMAWWALPVSGLVAALLLVPQFHDLVVGRTSTVMPLGLTVHGIGPDPGQPKSIADALLRLALIPFAYFVQFGVFAIGAIAFLRSPALAATRATPIGRLLLWGAPVALLLATFVRSTIIYNDFGWRAMWFAQVPAFLWTASVLSSREESFRRSWLWVAAIALGLAATAWDLVGLRLIRAPLFGVTMAVVNAHPEVDYDARATYRWIDRNLPPGMMVQHNPANLRGINFGLYGDRPVPMSDFQARLFGADPAAVRARGAMLRTIFEWPLPLPLVAQRARSAGAGAVLLTSADPLWRANGGPPADWTCAYRSPHTCVMLVGDAR